LVYVGSNRTEYRADDSPFHHLFCTHYAFCRPEQLPDSPLVGPYLPGEYRREFLGLLTSHQVDEQQVQP
jgi:hypothetical protein